ncbi:prepilin-type N-terminal cleavage/methylation domain-containing protein [Paenibacillus sp. GSMTC-2017]|uniref:prepilin-type N-terminal cleavage/methylation domain-containing protein n=1 Tax=Paenibacillus sp. GSMTC-2017 TaxID=2794350 RepID=UPI0018D99FA5|nr:prepilin-type N-terminal cleavage/methylation domain-containing protein [Paenibacillus sp. GSMTC-2017]MBH5318231.1 prepilin-type N-terminal cleavage/methylation domain-containing protein [Paenibacillus sp. GSMTC-2017]
MLTALKRNEKGLTLIELLAVLVIVGIIAAIAIPAIGGTITKSKAKADIATEALIKEAALRYLVDEDIIADTAALSITTELVNKGYLNITPTWNTVANKKTQFKATLSGGAWSIQLIA